MGRVEPSYLIPPSMEGAEPYLGEGISRPLPGERTKLFNLLVTVEGTTPMRTTIRAATASKAKLYAKNRWPNSNAIIIK
jgi:hypothetical protein